jgi:hypothetical protein
MLFDKGPAAEAFSFISRDKERIKMKKGIFGRIGAFAAALLIAGCGHSTGGGPGEPPKAARPAPDIVLGEGGKVGPGTLVTLSTETVGAAIYYTIGGGEPDPGKPEQRYKTPIAIDDDTVIRAVAVKEGMTPSGTLEAAYTVDTDFAASPSAGLPAGAVGAGTVVKLTAVAPGAAIRYTTDGSEPTGDSEEYDPELGIPINAGGAVTIRAITVKEGMTPSAVMEVVYRPDTKTVASPVPGRAPGAIEAGTKVTLATATPGAAVYYTTDGSVPTGDSEEYDPAAGITISGLPVALRAVAVKEGMTPSAVMTALFTAATHAISGYESAQGRVTADKTTAPAWETVTLTVTPADNYKLIGKPSVTKPAGGRVKLSGTEGTFTFIMPAAAVTVTADFTDKGESAITIIIDFADDAALVTGGTENPGISRSGGQTLTVTTAEGITDIRWSINGTDIPGDRGGAASITIAAADYPAGEYLLGIAAKKGNAGFSNEIAFTVRD